MYVANLEDDFVPHLRPKAEKMSFSMGLSELLILSSMLATKIPLPSSKTATSKFICRQRQPFSAYLLFLRACHFFIIQNCEFRFGRNVVK